MRYWFLLAILVLGCTATGDATIVSDSTSVRLVVSTGLGEQVLFDKAVLGSGDVIMILSQHTEIETTYGGKFIDSINGLKTEPGSAWFYYVNGKLMDRGAAAYIPKNGDIIQWDFHEYSENPFEADYIQPPSLK